MTKIACIALGLGLADLLVINTDTDSNCSITIIVLDWNIIVLDCSIVVLDCT